MDSNINNTKELNQDPNNRFQKITERLRKIDLDIRSYDDKRSAIKEQIYDNNMKIEEINEDNQVLINELGDIDTNIQDLAEELLEMANQVTEELSEIVKRVTDTLKLKLNF